MYLKTPIQQYSRLFKLSVTLYLSMAIGFVVTYALLPRFIEFLRLAGIVGFDIQKSDKPQVAEMGGPVVLMGFLSGIFLFIWVRVFLYGTAENLIELLAAVATILMITVIGIFDDLGRLIKTTVSKDRFGNVKRIGLKQWHKPLFTLPAAIPLMAVMAGDSTIVLPVFGAIDVGILFPLLLVPIGVVGASNAINMLAGLNGLEAGMSIVLLGSMGIYAFLNNQIAAAAIALIMVAALLAFLKFNWYPAKIIPGDSLPYCIGAAVAAVAVIGNMERFAVIAFAPWFIELILKSKARMKAEAFGLLQKDGTLQSPYDRTYSLTHVIMKLGKFREDQIVKILIAIEVVFCLFAFAVSIR